MGNIFRLNYHNGKKGNSILEGNAFRSQDKITSVSFVLILIRPDELTLWKHFSGHERIVITRFTLLLSGSKYKYLGLRISSISIFVFQ